MASTFAIDLLQRSQEPDERPARPPRKRQCRGCGRFLPAQPNASFPKRHLNQPDERVSFWQCNNCGARAMAFVEKAGAPCHVK